MFTPNQIAELLGIIRRTHITFLAKQVGTKVLSNDDKGILKKHGIDISKLPKTGKVDDAFRFGMLADALEAKAAKKLDYFEFKKFLAEGKMIPLSKVDKFALGTVRQQMYNDINNLSNKISQDITQIVTRGNKEKKIKYEKIIREKSEEAILNRSSVRELASELAHKTGDWARDFDRVADYVMHEAFDRGKAQNILSDHGGNARVYKEVYPGACKHCQRLYLTGGLGSKPKVFRLSTLIRNGSNIGRKVIQWLAVLGSTHPWCRCELIHIPAGYKYDEESKTFEPVRETKGVERKAKVKVTIT